MTVKVTVKTVDPTPTVVVAAGSAVTPDTPPRSGEGGGGVPLAGASLVDDVLNALPCGRYL